MDLSYFTDVLDKFYDLFFVFFNSDYVVFLGAFFIILCLISWLRRFSVWR